jgi:aarF domain-containing kinase
MGQMMSIRPDIIPAAAAEELQKLQDNVARFDNNTARALVESELGQPIDEIFSEFSEEPIAAASLAQVYRARLRKSGVEVAVKIQRPDALALCSKDMYVLQRAAGFYGKAVKRFTAQNVDYDALLASFATGFFNELDFRQEARNQDEARTSVLKRMSGRIYIPKVIFEHCTRRVLVTEFIYGTKLTDCEDADLRRLTAVSSWMTFLARQQEDPIPILTIVYLISLTLHLRSDKSISCNSCLIKAPGQSTVMRMAEICSSRRQN